MAPAWRAPDITEFCTPRRKPDVVKNTDPFVEHIVQQVECAQLLDDAITDALFARFLHKAAEHTVPHNENARIIAVQIARVGCVVDAVVRRRIHHRLEPFWHAINRLGVNPELIDQVYRAAKGNHRRMETGQCQWQAEDKAKCNKAHPCLPQRSR